MPMTTALNKAAMGRIKAKANPNTEKVANIESMPVCGVAQRNAVVAAFEPPSFRRDMAVGMTPQEHKGSGIPNKLANMTERKLFCERYFW